ncbi:MAG TPA: hypothetical protein VEH04_17000 [Verrucomicrobiae bacterium]|nr:hypothetical protein [Verrucomicrobiae bacterium]
MHTLTEITTAIESFTLDRALEAGHESPHSVAHAAGDEFRAATNQPEPIRHWQPNYVNRAARRTRTATS